MLFVSTSDETLTMPIDSRDSDEWEREQAIIDAIKYICRVSNYSNLQAPLLTKSGFLSSSGSLSPLLKNFGMAEVTTNAPPILSSGDLDLFASRHCVSTSSRRSLSSSNTRGERRLSGGESRATCHTVGFGRVSCHALRTREVARMLDGDES